VNNMANGEVKLKVGELTAKDEAGRGIVRIDSDAMRKIGVKEGDIVELEGTRKTAAIVRRAYPADIGLNIIRMDGITRKNAGVGVGESVIVRRAEPVEARKVVLAPAEPGVILHVAPDLIKQNLLGRPLVKGDVIVPAPAFKRRGTTFFEDFFGGDFEDFFFTPFPAETKFIVVNTEPSNKIVRVGEITEVEVLKKLPEGMKLEARAIPAVTYEDIGGIKPVVEKVREMIELPLRHPEIFERLGIEPPKGVLLYGPPGTGKTLLAKAVANESGAYFISVNGPEFLSKFYGESLPYDEKILVRKNGFIQLEEIGKIVENREDVEVACFDENFKVTFKKIKDFIKHKTTGNLFEIKTKSGRKIRVTEYHSLFTLTENGLESKRTDELKVGSFIAIPNILPENSNPIEKIDLFEVLKEKDYGLTVRPKEVWTIVEMAANKLGWDKVAKILGTNRKYLYDVKNQNIGIRVSKFVKLVGEAEISLSFEEKERIYIYSKRSKVPSQLKLTNSLMFFFGLWLAEGSYSKNTPRLSLNTEEVPLVLAIISNAFDKIRIYKNTSKSADVWIFNSALGKAMKALGFNGHAREKKIPSFVFNVSREKSAAFLKGYISGDGTLNTKTYSPQVEITTYSKNIAHDIPYLLLFFGIVAKIYEEKDGRFRICISDKQNLERFLEIGFLNPSKNKKIEEYVSSCKEEGRIERVPLDAIKSKISINSSYDGLKSIGKNVLLKMDIPLELRKILEGDIFFDEIVEIKEIEAPEYVYDVEVENTHNFIAGFGGIFAHNSEANLRKIFEEAEKNAPAIIFFDEIDAIAPKREEVTGEVERRIVATLLSLMDGLKSRGKVIVIAATNRPDDLDPALRRPGRFDREIEVPVPDRNGRLEILKIHTRNMPLAKDVNLEEIADKTHGFVGADLMALCKEAAMSALRRVLPEIRDKLKEGEEVPKEVLEKLVVTKQDFENALRVVEPSAMREVLVEVPKVKWEDIGDLEEVKKTLREMVEWPLKYRESFERLGIQPPKGILLYGPPGCGKTLLAKAVATESGANFIAVKGPELLSKWFGESEKRVRDLFKKAKQVAPCIIFFDEIDALAPRRGAGMHEATERVVAQLLTEISGIEDVKNVVLIAATNRPELVDPALLRPGRFDKLVFIPPPDEKGRLEILKVHTRKVPLDKDVNLEEIAKRTEGYSGADLEALVREAAMNALREDINAKEIKAKHFEEALKKIPPSLSKELIEYYKKFEERKKQIQKEEIQPYIG
jgi:SpoVK/Ycf46/Vps4 family AAA+-type ATPase/intein/homing endonuclease